MKLISMEGPIKLYRMNTPRFAVTPLSGAGAAAAGGRFNRVGREALYLSFSVETAVAEYRQTSAYLPPATLCCYEADLPALVDLHLLCEEGWDQIWQSWQIDWRLMIAEHIDPPTWDMADIVMEAGIPGIIFPSMVHVGGSNLVLYPDQLMPPSKIRVLDPCGLLPKNDASWR